MMAASKSNPMIEAAIGYASHGWRVLPVKGKRPTLRNWPERASADPQEVMRWFDGKPSLNVGIATGEGSGIVVVDLDPRNGSELSIKRLEQRLGALPETVTADTGGGGTHLVYRYQEGLASKKPADGIDFLSNGKMFVAAPSVHPNTGALYQWRISPDEAEPILLPETWAEYLSAPGKPSGDDDGPITEGHRNDALMVIAGHLRARGASRAEIQTHLLEENALRCLPPLSDGEVVTIAESAAAYEAGGKSFKTQWQETVLLADMPPLQKLSLMAISVFADVRGRNCFPTQDQIAERAGCSRQTASKYLAKANDEGWIKTYRRAREGQGFNYGYVLTLKDVN